MAPLSEERAARLCDFLAGNARGTIVDAGCGWAELLICLLESAPSATGLGIDLNADAVAHGQARARQRGVADRISLIAGDVKAHLPEAAGAVLCIGSSQIWGPPVEARLPLDYRSAVRAIRALLDPGSPAVYGEAIWTANPTPEAIAPLANRVDEYVFLPELLDTVRDCGFVVFGVHQATLDEWDSFESGYTARYARWLTEHAAEHPDAAEVRGRMLAQSNAYFRGYRGVLGMAYLELLAA
ncbi:MAG TPA: methyltransferase domain-containing protein [Casimicrobiaceae bacterium]|nr:methyltransferase domain-containing protein [Casimicrobiaceae bacterium]